jgi:hypothetical protein
MPRFKKDKITMSTAPFQASATVSLADEEAVKSIARATGRRS